jgi:HSP20 family protein
MTYYKVAPRRQRANATETHTHDLKPAVDIVESADGFTLVFDLPGFEKDAINVAVEEGVLTVKGERKRAEHEKDENLFRHFERAEGTFERSFRLPDYVDGENIDAAFTNGVLKLELSKKEEAKPRTIKVK